MLAKCFVSSKESLILSIILTVFEELNKVVSKDPSMDWINVLKLIRQIKGDFFFFCLFSEMVIKVN